MRTKTISLYQFDELPTARAKENARAWFREGLDSNDFDYVIEDADRIAAILGIQIDRQSVKLMGGGTRQDPAICWSVSYSQSDGAWIEAHYEYAKDAKAKIRQEAPEDTVLHALADRLDAIQAPYAGELTARVKDDSWRAMDLDLDHPEKEVTDETYKAFREVIRDFERWIYDQLRTQDEYLSSDEYVDETILANEYEFTEDGERA